MSVLPPSLFEALEADASLWPGGERVREAPAVRAALERQLGALPADVRQVLLSAMVDPDRNDWSRAALLGLAVASTAGASATGLATDDVIEMQDARGERFGLQPLGFRLPPHPLGPPDEVDRLLRGLDGAFGYRRYVLCIRKTIPAGTNPGPICNAVQLWLAQRDRTDLGERHAVYEDELISLDFTVVDDDPTRERGGRLLTFGPLTSFERMDAVQEALLESTSRAEESLGTLPLVVVAAADGDWSLPRSLVTQRLYGLAERTTVDTTCEAEFIPTAAAKFAHPALRSVCALWWIGPGGFRPTSASPPIEADPLSYRIQAYENPWASASLALGVSGPRFAPVDDADRRIGRVVLRWVVR